MVIFHSYVKLPEGNQRRSKTGVQNLNLSAGDAGRMADIQGMFMEDVHPCSPTGVSCF
jgi:hypothetical protein